ncbi:ABC transporter A family member 1 [Phytophthora cinnamomi]|uniref:ABC transporter A family member 1 n=1 Tax=Phytophthora cinnamomi TaxID=4785 RepID=UPI00355A29E0|nr:ABC transporter A family member 1 [Phytophthora cinnamomi]
MTSVWRRLQLRIAGTTPARRFQEEADVGVVAVLSCFRNLKLDPQNVNKKQEDLFDQAVEIVGTKAFEQQKQYVQDEVAKQVQSCFEAVLLMPKESEKNAPKMSLSGFERTNEVEEKLGITDNFQKLFGFTLNVEKSGVPDAGEGVKVRGSAAIGSLVALYPGIVYLPEHYKKKHYLGELSNNPYARARFDSVIIDAKNESSKPRNPLVVAHKINHPPDGTPPNVLGFAFEFPPEEPFTTKEFDELIPNSFVQEPSRFSMFGKRAIVHGLAFIATADIADGEELFLNYRYNPGRPLPEWYTPVDIESDRAMWK